MADSFNPYVAWLEIKTAATPPDHYALLGIASFESDRQVISAAAGAQLAKVRGIRPGSRLTEWQRVIDELTAAKTCLCDPNRKGGVRQNSPAAPGAGRFARIGDGRFGD